MSFPPAEENYTEPCPLICRSVLHRDNNFLFHQGKIHSYGIELRIEMLRVQESLTQMCAVAAALSLRVEKIRMAQEKFIKDFSA